MPEARDVLGGVLSSTIFWILGAVTVWAIPRLRRWRSRPPLKVQSETYMTIDPMTTIALGMSHRGKRIRELWRIEFELTNRGRAPIDDVIVEWEPMSPGSELVQVDTVGSLEGEPDLQRVVGRRLEPKEKATVYFYVDGRKKPTMKVRTASSGGPGSFENPRIPETDSLFYVFGSFAALQTVATLIDGKFPLMVGIDGVLTGLFFGIPAGFHMVRRWRDAGLLLP